MKRFPIFLLYIFFSCGDPDVSLLSITRLQPVVNPNIGILIRDYDLSTNLSGDSVITGYGSGYVFRTANNFQSFQIAEIPEFASTNYYKTGFINSEFIVRYSPAPDGYCELIKFIIFEINTGEATTVEFENLDCNSFAGIQFFNPFTGILLQSIVYNGSRTTAISSFDLQKSEINPLAKFEFQSPINMHFANVNIGYVIMDPIERTGSEDKTSVALTIDSGINWTDPVTIDNENRLRRIYSISDKMAIVYDYKIGKITRDGGQNWTDYDIPINNPSSVVNFCFVAPNHGFYLDYYGIVHESKDMGTSWDSIGRISDYWGKSNIQNLQFSNEQNGIITGPDEVYKTSDGGQTWETLIYPFNYTKTE